MKTRHCLARTRGENKNMSVDATARLGRFPSRNETAERSRPLDVWFEVTWIPINAEVS